MLLALTLCTLVASETHPPPLPLSESDEMTTNSLPGFLARQKKKEAKVLVYVGQTIKLKCKKSRGVNMLPGEKKQLKFLWSKDGQVRDIHSVSR